jgi:hypothetical protein
MIILLGKPFERGIDIELTIALTKRENRGQTSDATTMPVGRATFLIFNLKPYPGSVKAIFAKVVSQSSLHTFVEVCIN